MSQLLEAPTRAPGPTGGRGRHRRRPTRRAPRLGPMSLILAVALVSGGVATWRIAAHRQSNALASAQAHQRSGSGRARPSARPSPVQPQKKKDRKSPPTPVAHGAINTVFSGITTFRGNATRDYYGEGPLPTHPVVLWRYPASGGLCSSSTDNHGTRNWCGTGWTGQPNVIVSKGGKIELRFGAYDGHYHFLDGATGRSLRPDLVTGDLAKGSATSDPDGYPLYYGGSRDNLLRVVGLDRPEPSVLWSLDANDNPSGMWNDDWDGAPLVVGDYLLEGGENSWFYVIRLHRHYGSGHLVQVDPKVVMAVPGYDDQLIADLGDHDVSIENSVAFDAATGVVYFANSGGLVQGWDITGVLRGGTKYHRVFRFWAGDEVDGSIVIDPQGYLYVARHVSANVPTRPKARDHEIGSLMKLDPRNPQDPLVWSLPVGGFTPDEGILGTPALHRGVVYVTDASGGFLAVGQKTGQVLSRTSLPGPTWMSPVPVDGQLLVGDCSGVLHDFDVSDPRHPKELWAVQLEGCIESTPALWKGMIWVGARGGAMYGIADPE